MTPSLTGSRTAGCARCGRCPTTGSTAGGPGTATSARSWTERRAGTRSTGSCPPRSTPSWPSPRRGARSTAATASSPTEAPTRAWCGWHRRRSGVFWQLTGSSCLTRPPGPRASTSRGRTGWSGNRTGSGPTTPPTSRGPRRVVFPIVDMVSRKWIDTLVSVEETATQVQVLFEHALELEGLLELLTDERLDLAVDDPARPILLAVSDNGPPMAAADTRAFMALMAIAQHRGRP